MGFLTNQNWNLSINIRKCQGFFLQTCHLNDEHEGWFLPNFLSNQCNAPMSRSLIANAQVETTIPEHVPLGNEPLLDGTYGNHWTSEKIRTQSTQWYFPASWTTIGQNFILRPENRCAITAKILWEDFPLPLLEGIPKG